MILLMDHYDSFVYNLARYIEEIGQAYEVKRFDDIDEGWIESCNPSHLIFSPGPCTPDQAQSSLDLILAYSGKKPILGVCLGHQCIAQVFGAKVMAYEQPRHGQTSFIRHQQHILFQDIPSPFRAARYHSLHVLAETLPADLEAIAWSDDDKIMAIAHIKHPTFGVQFHPEAHLTEYGHQILRNFTCMSI